MEPGRLPTAVDVTIRMRAMVTTNIDADRDVANGACGKVVEIILDSREPTVEKDQCQVTLRYPPAWVLVNLDYIRGNVGDLEE